MVTYAITGASGQLGAHAVRELLKMVSPQDITLLVRDRTKVTEFTDQGVRAVTADYNDSDTLQAALVGVDRLLLISSNDLEHRFDQHVTVIDAAQAAGVRKVAYTSILKANTTTNVLAPDHKKTEDYLMRSGLDYLLLRHGWYSENYLEVAQTARQIGEIRSSAGAGRVSSASRADYAAADIAALTSDVINQVYELGGDHAWDFSELAATITKLTHTEVTYIPISFEQQVKELLTAGLDEKTARFVASLDQNIAEGRLEDDSQSISTLINRPTTPLEETLRASLIKE